VAFNLNTKAYVSRFFVKQEVKLFILVDKLRLNTSLKRIYPEFCETTGFGKSILKAADIRVLLEEGLNDEKKQ
jgi:hypothetical protein